MLNEEIISANIVVEWYQNIIYLGFAYLIKALWCEVSLKIINSNTHKVNFDIFKPW